MRNKKIKFSTILLIVLSLTGLNAQEAILATGGNALGSGGTVSYSIGQVVYNMNSGTNGSEAQGVQQPYEISSVTWIEEANRMKIECTTYPNPTTDFLIVKFENYFNENLSYELYDMNGKQIESKRLIFNETRIKLKSREPSNYLLIIKEENKKIKTFKIIKN